LLAATASRWDDAAEHFEAAIGTNRAIGARPLVAQTQYDYAEMLLRRGREGDAERGLSLVARTLRVARGLGMTRLLEQSTALALKLRLRKPGSPKGPARSIAPAGGDEVPPFPSSSPPHAETPSAAATNVFRREGDYWTLALDGTLVRLKDAKGFHH